MTEVEQPQPHAPTLSEMVLYFLKLGTLGFGGPVVLCEHMRKDLVGIILKTPWRPL
jgi:chromate transporter